MSDRRDLSMTADARGHAAWRVAVGLAYALAGVLLLLGELGVLTVTWSVVVPVVFLLAGAALLVEGVTAGHRS